MINEPVACEFGDFFQRARFLKQMRRAGNSDAGYPERHAQLALLYAYIHRTDDALREGRRAVEIEPESPIVGRLCQAAPEDPSVISA